MNFNNENGVLNLMRGLLETNDVGNRTNVNAASKFCHTLRFDLSDGTIPLLTTKAVNFKAIIAELIWFLRGSTSNKLLNKLGTGIWNEWACPKTESLGTIYGAMWRRRPVSLAAIGQEISVEKLNRIYAVPAHKKLEVELVELHKINELNKDIDELVAKNRHLYTAWKEMISSTASRYLDYLAGEDVFVAIPLSDDREERKTVLQELKQGFVGQLEPDMFSSISVPTIDSKWLSFEQFLDDVGSIAFNEQRPKNVPTRLTTYFMGCKHYSARTCVFYVEALQFINKGFLERSTPEHQHQYRPLVVIDQLADVMDKLSTAPLSRRLIVNSWEPSLMPDESTEPRLNPAMGLQALTPCHHEFQLMPEPLYTASLIEMIEDDEVQKQIRRRYIDDVVIPAAVPETRQIENSIREHAILNINKHREASGQPPLNPYKLNLRFSMRSSDTYLGLPFNLASYGALAIILAKKAGMVPGVLEYQGTNVHMYVTSMQAATEQCSREVLHNFPKLEVADFGEFEDLTLDHFTVVGYEPQSKLSAPVAV